MAECKMKRKYFHLLENSTAALEKKKNRKLFN
jgi:hypothetical protein